MSDSQIPTSRRAFLGAAGVAAAGGLAFGGTAVAQQDDNGDGGARSYRVTVTNNTAYQPFTPPAVAAHRASVEVFSVGDEANEAVKELAENGNLGPLSELIESTNAIRGAAVGEGPLVPQADPGETDHPYFTELHLEADASASHLTFLSMLIATNDGFTGLDTVPLPSAVNASRTYVAASYDAGTEENTERFEDLVPPAQTLTGVDGEDEGTGESNPDLAEDGVITPHRGITGEGDLDPEKFDWDDPVAIVQVERTE